MKHNFLRWSAMAIVAAALAACGTPSGTRHSATGATLAQQAAQPQVSRQALGQGLYEVAYSPRQNAVFVAASGGFGEGADAPRILRLNPDTLAVQAEIKLERKGFGVVLDDEADRLYVGNTSDAAITVIDTAANQVIGVVQLAEKISGTGPDGKVQERYPHNFREMVIDKANHRLYAPGLWFKDSALYVVDTRKLALETVIPGFGFVATGITLDARRNALYVSNLQGQLYTVDTRTLAIRDKAEVQGDQLLNLALDSKRNRVLAIDQGMDRIDGMRKKLGGLDYQNRGNGNQVVVIDPADGSVLHSIPTGEGPVALLLDEQRDRLYVTNRGSGTVTVYDSSRYALLHSMALPAHPNSLSLDPKTGAVYASVKNGSDDPKGSKESVARIQF
ncbi:YncE family protein [Pusillimonas sp. SM2304]|uniref:YncE family protein n=1 Tax=Pusillimonas sp. SM2304 TaxID=3073241 RepID=UPI002876B751|nr:YncE family protein [Pusillimonas sp. SM2304]MDS1139417.1 YncE family protein [Pusillimonas sp. SM2304]